MRTWISKNAATIGAVTGVAALFTTIAGSLLYLLVTQPMNHRFDLTDQRFVLIDQRFDTIDQRFDNFEKRMEQCFAHAKEAREQNFSHLSQRIEDLADDVSQIHKLTTAIGERVSQTERQIDAIEQQLQIADAPAP